MRLIRVAVKPHTGCRGMRGPTCDGVLRLVTNRLDLPAERIAEIDRLRWVIEMFFRTFKQLLGCKHLFSDKHNGVEIQASCAMIVCMLILIYTGENSARGSPCPRAGYGGKRSQDGEAQRTCSESRPGGPRRTSGERAWVAPSGTASRSPHRLRDWASWRSERPATGHGQPLASQSCPTDFAQGSSWPEARAEAGDTCGRWTPTFRPSRELTHRRWVGDLIAAGAEHASGQLRGPDDPR
jgi:hypothetical protein